MEKETFCKILNALELLYEENRKFEEALAPFFDEAYCDLGLQSAHIITEALEKEMNDVTDDICGSHISYWLIDYKCGKRESSFLTTHEGKEIHLKTPDELYDYLLSNKSN